MRPEADDIAPVLGWSDRQFGDWVRAGVVDYPARGRLAFTPLHTFVGTGHDLVEDLLDVHALLPEREKTAFRSGLAIALAETPLTQRETVEKLLSLARRTHATHVLHTFAKSTARSWRDSDDDALVRSIGWTIGILVKFAGDSSLTAVSVECLMLLARSPRVPASYGPQLFLALCELSGSITEALATFWPLLDAALGDEVAGVEVKRERLIEEAAEICGRNAVLRTLTSFRTGSFGYSWWQTTVVTVLFRSNQQPGDLEAEFTAPQPPPATLSPVVVPLRRARPVPTAAWMRAWNNAFPDAFHDFARDQPGGTAAQ